MGAAELRHIADGKTRYRKRERRLRPLGGAVGLTGARAGREPG